MCAVSNGISPSFLLCCRKVAVYTWTLLGCQVLKGFVGVGKLKVTA